MTHQPSMKEKSIKEVVQAEREKAYAEGYKQGNFDAKVTAEYGEPEVITKPANPIEQMREENESLAKELRIVSNMINMGEKIQWGQDTFLMDKAADALESAQIHTNYRPTDWTDRLLMLAGVLLAIALPFIIADLIWGAEVVMEWVGGLV